MWIKICQKGDNSNLFVISYLVLIVSVALVGVFSLFIFLVTIDAKLMIMSALYKLEKLPFIVKFIRFLCFLEWCW